MSRGSLFARLADMATLPGDSADDRLSKRLQISMAAASIPMIGMWGLSFVALGHAALAFKPALYCATTAAMLVVLGVTKRYAWFRTPHTLLVLTGPFLLHWEMGGFRGSGGAMLWCLLTPVATMMFEGPRRSIPSFVMLLGLIVLGFVREVYFPPARYVLSPDEMSFYFAFNSFGFACFLFLSTRYFVSRIDVEKARAERLLLNVLPASIAERLKREEGVIADRHAEATVLFADIVGFTSLSARMPATELVVLLDEIFTRFDDIAGRHGLEKIKTIGDAYMAVGGLPAPQVDHAARVAAFALEALASLAEFTAARNLDLTMRIGVHTGEVVAGVIGRRKFSYDLWGDTVNTASRMESHGAPGRVQLSEAARHALGDAFDVEERGPVAVKGKGEMRTFWLVARRPASTRAIA